MGDWLTAEGKGEHRGAGTKRGRLGFRWLKKGRKMINKEAADAKTLELMGNFLFSAACRWGEWEGRVEGAHADAEIR